MWHSIQLHFICFIIHYHALSSTVFIYQIYNFHINWFTNDKVHGTLLQRLQYLPYLGGAPFTVVRPPLNIAMYRCILLRLSLQCFHLPLQCSAFCCNIVFCPPLQCSSSFRRCTIHGTWCVQQKCYTLA